MSFWERIKQALRGFMAGRNGMDPLCIALLWTGIILYLLGSIHNFGILTLVGFAAYVVTLFRMFSRNKEKRALENRRYLAMRSRLTTQIKQAQKRFQNRKQYKYFKCPGCKAWLKLPKGAGVVTVTCSRCQNSFTQKA